MTDSRGGVIARSLDARFEDASGFTTAVLGLNGRLSLFLNFIGVGEVLDGEATWPGPGSSSSSSPSSGESGGFLFGERTC